MLTLKLASKTHDKNFFCQWWLWQPFFLSEPITAKLFEIQIWRQTNSQSESWMTTGWFNMEPANILRAQCPKKLVSIETNYSWQI